MYKIPIIFDVDTGLDDATTLFMACISEHLDILGVTATYGNNSLEQTLRNTLNVLKLCGREDIPVAAGADKPLVRKFDKTDEKIQGGKIVHGENGLGGFKFPFEDTRDALSSQKAWDFAYEKIMASPEPVVYCCLGPLTDPAILLRKYPDVKNNLKCIVNMGGYIREGTLSPMSSVNIFYDAHGAAIVMESEVPFYMCPGDLTKNALITLDEMAQLKELKSVVGKAASQMIHAYYTTCSRLGENEVGGLTGQSMHDNCALAFIEHPEMFTYGRYYCRVETQSDLCIAMTVIDYEDTMRLPKERKNLYFVDSINRQAFAEYFLDCFRQYDKREEK